MIEGIPRISVLVITYNQEDVIRRAIDSLLAQKDYIYEICVSDDCSKDRTWDILQDYSDRYPGLFVLNRNNPNVGIFENCEKTWAMPSGDVIYQLSGDDEAGCNWFEKVVSFIISSNIDVERECFCIYGDYKYVKPNGDFEVYRNSKITTGIDPVHLALRWEIGNRSCCFSKRILEKYTPVSQGHSHIAETAQDRLLQLYTDTNYYINSIGNIYYGGIGVSTKIYESEELFKERLGIMPYALSVLKEKGYNLHPKDRFLSEYVQSLDYYNRNNSLRNKWKLIYYMIKTYDCTIDSLPMFFHRVGSIMIH